MQTPFLEAGVRRGGTITTGGVAQDVAAANETRRGLTFQNTSDTDMWLTETDINAAAGTGYKVAPGVTAKINTNLRVSVYCATAGKTFAATEF